MLESYFVYALSCREPSANFGYAKVGYTRCPNKRLGQLKSSCPIPAHHFYVAKIGHIKRKAQQVETSIHRQLRQYRANRHGEWYKLDLATEDGWRLLNVAFCKAIKRIAPKTEAVWQGIDVIEAERLEAYRRYYYCRYNKGKKIAGIRAAKALHDKARKDFNNSMKMVSLEDLVARYSDSFRSEIS